MSTFRDAVTGMVVLRADGSPQFNLTQEQKEALATITTVDNIKTYDSLGINAGTVAVEIEKAMNQLVNSNAGADNVGIIADWLVVKMPDGTEVKFPCTISKATNVQTENIVEAVVDKFYAVCHYTQNSKNRGPNSQLRTNFKFMFEKPQAITDVTDGVSRKAVFSDVSLSATVVPGSIVMEEELDKLINSQHALKTLMVIRYLQEIAATNPSDEVLLAVYRQINRPLTDDIFSIVFEKYFGAVDMKDAAQVKQFCSLRDTFRKNLQTIGSLLANSDTIEFGINIRSMSISEDLKWTSQNKINRVKQFSGKSYYVSEGTDVGYQTIPTTANIFSEFKDAIADVVKDSIRFVEAEVAAEHGFKTEFVISGKQHELKDIDADYYKHLGISAAKQAEVLGVLESKLYALAELVVNNAVETNRHENLSKYAALMGGE